MNEPLLRLVSDTGSLEDCWENRPLVSRGLGDFADVFSLATVEAVLATKPLVRSSVRLMREGEVGAESLTRPRERGGPGAERLIDPAKVADEVRRGATLVMEEVKSCCPEVADFAQGIENATGYATYCAAFLTPAGARGAAPHYDLASVFLRQVYGSKRWQIGRPVEQWPTEPWNRRPVPIDDTLDVLLEEGDCLYLPRGYVHVGDATGEASLHLSIAVKPVTWATVLTQQIAALAAREPLLREALPFGFHREPDEKMTELLAARAALLDGLSCEEMWKAARERHSPGDDQDWDGDLRGALRDGDAA